MKKLAKLLIALMVLTVVPAFAQITPTTVPIRWLPATPASCVDGVRAQALVYNWTTDKLYKCSGGTYAEVGAAPAGLLAGGTTNNIPYFTSATTLGNSGFTIEPATGHMITPLNKSERIWGSAELTSLYVMPYQTNLQSYAIPAGKYVFPFGYHSLTVTSVGAGGHMSAGWTGNAVFEGVTAPDAFNGMSFSGSCSTGATCASLTGGQFATANTSALAGTGTYTGLTAMSYSSQNGTASTNLIGGDFSAGHTFSSNTTTNVFMLRARQLGNGTGTISNVYGLALSSWARNGGLTVTNSYGIYADTTIDYGTNKYFIYSLSTSPSLFSGNVTVGGAGKFYVSTSQTPASAAEACTAGQIAWDASYMYVCTATDTWKRAAIATW